MNIIKYWIIKRKVKRYEIKLKFQLYSTLAYIIDNNKDITGLIQRLYVALKDVPVEELQKAFVSEISQLAHEQVVKDRQEL